MEVFAINSNLGKNGAFSNLHASQEDWLKSALGNSTATWKLVYFHHSPFTTAKHDPPATWMIWPFQDWGATAVFSGHEHSYERIVKQNPGMAPFTFVVTGLGGHPWLYEINGPTCTPEQGSQVRYNSAHGFLAGFATKGNLEFCFYSTEMEIVDNFSL